MPQTKPKAEGDHPATQFGKAETVVGETALGAVFRGCVGEPAVPYLDALAARPKGVRGVRLVRIPLSKRLTHSFGDLPLPSRQVFPARQGLAGDERNGPHLAKRREETCGKTW